MYIDVHGYFADTTHIITSTLIKRREIPNYYYWSDDEAATIIQSHWRGYLVRKTTQVKTGMSFKSDDIMMINMTDKDQKFQVPVRKRVEVPVSIIVNEPTPTQEPRNPYINESNLTTDDVEKRKDFSEYTEIKFRCNLCFSMLDNKDDVKDHSNLHLNQLTSMTLVKCHNIERSDTNMPKIFKIGRNYNCEKCKLLFTSQENLDEHKKDHKQSKGKPQYKCERCVESFNLKTHLSAHIIKAHINEKKFQCHYDGCYKGFMLETELEIHLDSHGGSNIPYICQFCNESFVAKYHLEQHYEIHQYQETDIKICKICNLKFRKRLDLQCHVKNAHSEEKPFNCTFCGKKFITRSRLTEHIRSHTGEKPFKCTECSWAFASASNLKQHIKCHKGFKPYKCQHCHLSFSTRGNLKQHMHCHTGEKPFACEVCTRKFRRRRHVVQHLYTVHSATTNYMCDICAEMFIGASNLHKHMQEHKKKESKKLEKRICTKKLKKPTSLSNTADFLGNDVNCSSDSIKSSKSGCYIINKDNEPQEVYSSVNKNHIEPYNIDIYDQSQLPCSYIGDMIDINKMNTFGDEMLVLDQVKHDETLNDEFQMFFSSFPEKMDSLNDDLFSNCQSKKPTSSESVDDVKDIQSNKL
ncbi:hypothetical protein A3Q56_06049 [Intoshia linei]|uniref:C2H2-type domain-containing protein n=1 Tax=Intoshia linei TaxID=1819745 RepID=A0A177AYF3_9BILA|nr:hypothetical protein A3Q56_06049 [Intoshia linei]